MQRDSRRVLGEYLVIAAQGGDRAACGQLARLWQPALLRHAVRLTGEAELARDTLQDAWIDILRGLGGLADAAAFPAWAYRIVTRKSAATVRGLQRRRQTGAALAAEPEGADDGERNAEALADRGPLARALAALPVEQRTAMALFYIDDFTVAEIAVALNSPVGTIKTRLMHGRRKMRTALETPTPQPRDTGGQDDRK
ncbi:RNA polymerase sigma factor [uncultured Maricaulis sp.]|uniref:RNA polymerase sigma factor n=1 Tax=uncultured Maricaulis sp. TaxID=174710 RepID=UPI0030DCF5FF|tara:strand:+ start:4299 stop:4892 length:594 start_codon:yes stop_codon:yes gene_type:complete